MTSFDDPWIDADAPDVRPYALTQGRTRPTRDLTLATLVKAGRSRSGVRLSPEHGEALELCRHGPRSVAEIAGVLKLPVQVTKVLLSDLIDARSLVVPMPATDADPTDPLLLEALLAGLRQL
ncbi:DUF742 domain-containing protein [Streptomyces sp. 7-21]|jgi:hypothetical protein|uniref:DUF742 domain-containing protein n=1 Tax=Streptomyces sp. 7-21 TaxID=2802283 RepID=UPI00192016AA|nr:DUF742 domain-containing protein [Streptomyces sp. 7-21]MBL1066437.1 DUF742 domain-containing protein [Streptomyces sp. 7-21]